MDVGRSSRIIPGIYRFGVQMRRNMNDPQTPVLAPTAFSDETFISTISDNMALRPHRNLSRPVVVVVADRPGQTAPAPNDDLSISTAANSCRDNTHPRLAYLARYPTCCRSLCVSLVHYTIQIARCGFAGGHVAGTAHRLAAAPWAWEQHAPDVHAQSPSPRDSGENATRCGFAEDQRGEKKQKKQAFQAKVRVCVPHCTHTCHVVIALLWFASRCSSLLSRVSSRLVADPQGWCWFRD